MPFVTRAGEPDIHYAVDDHTDPWTAPPTLVLQHGNGRSGAFWYASVPALARHFRVVRPDMRGLGRSSRDFDPVSGLSLDALLGDLLAVLDALGPGPVHYCGESMGGILGLALAALHPARVRTLTIISTPVFISDTMKQTYAVGHGSRFDAMRDMGIRNWVDHTNRTTRFPPDMDPGFLAWYADEFAKGDTELLIRYAEFVCTASAMDFLPRVKAPVLGLYPSGGQITDRRQEALLTQHLPDFELVHLPTPYHMVHQILPDACTAALRDFLRRRG